jgi:uncharacterized protein YbgA (DUF1722 family)/uncharacterized protein YbbK (DUF523 family)
LLRQGVPSTWSKKGPNIAIHSIKLGISTCLLGERVRWNGGHKLDQFLTDTLGQFVQYCPVCPEVECGFGVPREPLRLVGDPHAPRLITARARQDYTNRMLRWARRRVSELKGEELSGFVFKGASPSCGMKGVKVYNEQGVPTASGTGLFVRVFMDRFPLLPVEDEGRLHDPSLRENFIERVFTMKRWRDASHAVRHSRGALVQFHTENKLLILSHSPGHYRRMGRLVAEGVGMPISALYQTYQQLLMEALLLKATPAKHYNCLQHITGYFKKQLSADARQELSEVIEHYREGLVPLIVPITLINHFERLVAEPYLHQQYYLHPHPLELQLRNHV